MKRLLLLVMLALAIAPACSKTPPALSPEAVIAFQAFRVIRVLDVVRDAAIAANELTPPMIKTDDTRTVVLWHKVAVQTIAATPGGWKPTVKASIYVLSCHPQAYVPGPGIPLPDACQPQIPADANARLRPYIGLALVVIAEVI
jgi:hypothetical protein